jgi:hypothetical protein
LQSSAAASARRSLRTRGSSASTSGRVDPSALILACRIGSSTPASRQQLQSIRGNLLASARPKSSPESDLERTEHGNGACGTPLIMHYSRTWRRGVAYDRAMIETRFCPTDRVVLYRTTGFQPCLCERDHGWKPVVRDPPDTAWQPDGPETALSMNHISNAFDTDVVAQALACLRAKGRL